MFLLVLIVMTQKKSSAIPKKLFLADELMDLVASDIDMTLINPTNADTIKDEYNGDEPTFLYNKPPNYIVIRKELKKLTFPKSPAGQLLEKKRDYLLTKTSLIRAIGTKQFTKYSKRLYPTPRKKLLRAAHEILALPDERKPEKMDIRDAVVDLKQCIDDLGIAWSVERVNMVASACVVPSKRAVYIKDKKEFSKQFIDRLKVHEIGTHAVRAENGRLQPYKIFIHGTAGYLATEEGLAAYNEEQAGLLSRTVLKTYAGRVLAVSLAQKKSFTQVVEALQEHFSQKKALTIALRVKRGVGHGSQLGGYTKDSVYLQGYLALKEFEKKKEDFSPLYYGKVGLDDLAFVKQMKGLKKPKYHPSMIQLDE